jgi:hypothetical protein
LLLPFDLGQMSVKTRIGLVDQLAVKPLFANARLVSGYQKNGLAVWVEREGHTPDTVSGIKP